MTMPVTTKNKRNSYYLGSSVIKSDIEEKDLGVIVHESLKSTSQCVAAAKSANITLGMIRRTFIDNNCKTFLQLYQSLVQPKSEYCVQSWRPYLKKDIDMIEKVKKELQGLRSKTEVYAIRIDLEC